MTPSYPLFISHHIGRKKGVDKASDLWYIKIMARWRETKEKISKSTLLDFRVMKNPDKVQFEPGDIFLYTAGSFTLYDLGGKAIRRMREWDWDTRSYWLIVREWPIKGDYFLYQIGLREDAHDAAWGILHRRELHCISGELFPLDSILKMG